MFAHWCVRLVLGLVGAANTQGCSEAECSSLMCEAESRVWLQGCRGSGVGEWDLGPERVLGLRLPAHWWVGQVLWSLTGVPESLGLLPLH